jgi:hypothetical protein
MAKCPKTKKTQYKTHDQAAQGIVFIWSNDPNIKQGDLHSYVCPYCKMIHIGHTQPKPVREAK